MKNFPQPILDLIQDFTKLPGIGKKTAERFVFFLLTQQPEILDKFGNDLKELLNSIVRCNICQNYADQNPCSICSDYKRNTETICVVATSQNFLTIENTREYNGLYHVLGGNLNPLEGITPQHLTINALLKRVQNTNVQEIILALNPDITGEATALYLTKILKEHIDRPLKISRLARGLPMGSDLDYADVITLQSALEERKEL